MGFSDILSSGFEFILVLIAVWAVVNDDRLYALEKRIKAKLRRHRLRLVDSVTTRA